MKIRHKKKKEYGKKKKGRRRITRKKKIRAAGKPKNQTPWTWSASELYRPNDRRLSAKLVLTFAGRGCCVVGAKNSHGR
jgi:hypothetical protein